jgi:O-antigen ligase
MTNSLSARVVSVWYPAVVFLPLAFCALYPTDTQYLLWGKLSLLSLCLGGVWLGWRPQNRGLILPLVIVSLLFLSVLWSVSPGRSLEGALHAAYYILVFVLFRQVQMPERAVMWGLRLLVAASLLLAFDGLYQVLYGYQNYLQYLDTPAGVLSPATQEATRAWIVALAGRAFSRFALPSQLAGYLLMMLPLHGLLIVRERSRWLKICWAGGFILNVVVFFYTKSFGAWAALFGTAAIAGGLWLVRQPGLRWQTVLKAGAGLLVAGWAILLLIGWMRGQYLWDLQGNNPLWYRWLNWEIAFRMWADHLWSGTGLLTFGALYPQYMLPGANESQYVHNSYLQLGTELGLAGFVLTLWLVGAWAWKAISALRLRLPESTAPEPWRLQSGLCFFLAGVTFLLHNLIDFDLYVFPLGILAMAVLALTLNVLAPPNRQAQSEGRIFLPTPRVLIVYGLAACACIALYWTDWQTVHARQQQQRALTAIEQGQLTAAKDLIRKARRAVPLVAEYSALEGQVLLTLERPEAAIQRFRTAIRREPDTPWFHAGLAEAYLARQNLSMAYLESRQAADLFPQKPRYQEQVQHLEAILAEAATPP